MRSRTLALVIAGSAASVAAVPAQAALVGNGIARVYYQPGRVSLEPRQDNVLVAQVGARFRVVVENSGDTGLRRVRVRVMLQQRGATVRQTKLVYRLRSGGLADVLFPPLDDELEFAVPLKLRVRVDPVPQEANLANNSLELPVIFALQ